MHINTDNMSHRVHYLDDGGVKEALADFESFTAKVLVVAIRKLVVDSWHGLHHAANKKGNSCRTQRMAPETVVRKSGW